MSHIRIGIFFFFLSMFISCKSEYEHYVDQEIESGVRNDSLILGMYIGQTRKDFFNTCWQLNKQKLISQGTGNRTAKYIEPYDSLANQSLRKELLFYGIFDEKDVMQGMEMTYSYTTWAPWNHDKYSTFLADELKGYYMKHYGKNPFVEIDLGLPEYKAFVKIDGNRHILIYPKNKKDVAVKIEDIHFRLDQQKKREMKS
ncbi:MAG: hypothetical protein LW630_00270 [Saprospiraceae bacterium]|jgi:hypothetical protein|nr:hypothetical protein [Saprospiraceae bacterium]